MRNVSAIKGVIDQKQLSVIILGASSGRRMKSYGNKSLIPMADYDEKTLINVQVNTIRDKFPQVAEIVFVAGFEAEKIFKQLPPNIKFIENENYKDNNSLRSLNIGLRACLSNNVIIIHGDILFDKNALEFSTFSAIPVDNHGRISIDKVGITQDGNKDVITFDYGLNTMWSQIVFLTKKELVLARKVCSHREWDNFTTHEALNKIIYHGGVFKTFDLKKDATLKELNSASDI